MMFWFVTGASSDFGKAMMKRLRACGDHVVGAVQHIEAQPALRITLGSTAYESVGAALAPRLDSLHIQRDLAFSADRPDVTSPI